MSDISSTSNTTSTSSIYTPVTSSGGTSSSSDITRMTGLSGFDVDGTVKKLMVPYQQQIDKVKQQQQTIQWQQDAYRNIIGQINTFKSTYFDILSPNYILSQNAFSPMTVNSSDTTGSVTATANSTAQTGSYNVTISRLATTATISGNTLGTTMNAISSDPATHKTNNDWSNAQFTFKVNNQDVPPIILDSGLTGATVSDVVQNINKKIAASSLYGNVSASYVNTGGVDYIQFNNVSNGNSISLVSAVPINQIPAASDISQMSGETVKPPVTASTLLTSINSSLNADLSFNITYNNTSIPINLDNSSGTKTISDLINTINSQTGGNVTASLDQISGNFILQTKNTGSNSSLSIGNDSNNLLSSLGLAGVIDKPPVVGQDALVQITSPNGNTTTLNKNSNNFTLNGVNYSLNRVTSASSPVSLNVSANTKSVVDLVTGFVNKYNDLISAIDTKYEEKRQYDYPPLTDAQKASMSATDITNWNNQAQKGLLSGDMMLGNILTNLQNALFNVTDQSTFGMNLTAVGITTSSDVSQRGKLVIDSQKLTTAIQNNPNQVINLFIQQSSADGTTYYSPNMSSANRKTRTQNEGVFQRINDIFNDNVTTTRDANGNPGLLLQKAGLQGTVSEFNNSLTKQLTDIMTRISDMTTKMNDKQNQYYQQFSQMETALQQLNDQSSWLTQQLGG